MNEAGLTKKIIKALEMKYGHKALVSKIHGGMYQTSGLPDVIVCKMGRFVGIEVKMPGRESTLTARQASKLKKIIESGGYAGVATSPEQALLICKGKRQYEPH